MSDDVAPIFIMSFDRPDYLAKVLDSLLAQVDTNLEDREVVLFQDGGFNQFSKRQNASAANIADCIRVFEERFPEGTVKLAPDNLGVALNFERAEVFGFETLGAEAVIFLEDDLVLGDSYISTLDRLIRNFADDERVGYVAAYGDHTKSIDEQQKNERKLILLTHNWGFALFRRQWVKMRPRILEYLSIVQGCDYKDKDALRIKELFLSWGFGDPAISQDAAKTIACCIDNVVKLNTYVCNAKYIGERGLHMNSEIYAKRGYAETTEYNKRVKAFNALSDSEFEVLFADQKAWALSSHRKTTSAEPKTKTGSIKDASVNASVVMDGEAGVNKDDEASLSSDLVAAAYRAILGRDPDEDGFRTYSRLYVGRSVSEATFRVISGLLASREFTERWTILQSRPV